MVVKANFRSRDVIEDTDPPKGKRILTRRDIWEGVQLAPP